MNHQPEVPHVVIVGAGFAGLNAAKQLRRAPVNVTIVDRNNYHKFQPLLYEVAMAGLEPDDIAHNVRDIFQRSPNVNFQLGTVTGLDQKKQQVQLRRGEPIPYDYLLIAAGASTNYFGVDGAEEHAYPLKNVPDAVDLRNHVLRRFEEYDRAPEEAGEGALNFVVVGGGPTGVETAGAFVELFQVVEDDYPKRDTARKAQVHLVEMGPRLLPAYPEALGAYTRRTLEERGVRVHTDTTVSRVEPETVHFEGGDTLPARTLVWGAGVQPPPVTETLGLPLTDGGRLVVQPDLSVPGHANVFAAGDMCGATGERGDPLPQLAPVAIQEGEHAARQIVRIMRGQPTEGFLYNDLGKMATIGRNAAVADLPGGLTLTGFIAWFMWVTLHIAKLVGFRNRINTFVNWIYNYFTYDRNARLILDVVPISERIPMEAEEVDRAVKERMKELQ